MTCVLSAFGGTLKSCISVDVIVFPFLLCCCLLYSTIFLLVLFGGRAGAMAGVDPDLLAALQINDEESTDEEADQGNEIPRDDQRAEGQDEVFRPAPDSEQLEGVVKGGPEGAVNDPTKASGDVQGVGSPPPKGSALGNQGSVPVTEDGSSDTGEAVQDPASKRRRVEPDRPILKTVVRVPTPSGWNLLAW